MQREVLMVDHGREFFGARVVVRDKVVCVVTPRISNESFARKAVRDMIRSSGGNCSACRGCPAAEL